MVRTVHHDANRNYWTVRDEDGRVLGCMRGVGPKGGPYTATVGADKIVLNDRDDALLWLSLKTDTKENRDAYFGRVTNAA